jgi:hypothetical protein
LHVKLHFLDFEFPAPITRVAAPQMMSHTLGRANKFPRKDKWGMVVNLTFVLEKKDSPKLEFGRKYSLKGCMNIRCKIPT